MWTLAPVYCTLCVAQVPDSLRSQVTYNQRMLSPGANFIMLNGMMMEVKNFELYSKCTSAQDPP